MKRLLSILLTAVALSGCRLFVDKVTDVSQEAGYREVTGKEFRTLQPVVLYKIEKQKSEIELGEPGRGYIPELKDMDGKRFPYEANSACFVLGVLPAESVFRVEKVVYRQSFENSYVRYIAIITSDGPFQDLEVNPTWLTDLTYYPKVPLFDSKYVEEVVEEN
jgi:hypothetical protein